MLGKVRKMVFGQFEEQYKIGGVCYGWDPSGGLAICGAFSCKPLVSEMKLFFHGLDETDGRFSHEVVCGGWRCWEKVEGKYFSFNW